MEISRKVEGYERQLSDLVKTIKDVIRRRYITILAIAAAVLAVSVVLTMMMTPKYEAVARVRIDPSQNPLQTREQRDETSLTPEAIETEVTIMTSLDVARAVVRDLNLLRDSEFAKGIGEGADGTQMSADEKQTAVAQALLTRLSAGREKLTYIIALRFRSRDPIKAAKIVNSFADNYLKTKGGYSSGTASRQAQFYQSRLRELGAEMRQSEGRLADFRARTGLVNDTEGRVGTVADQQVPALTGSLAAAESDAAAARAAYQAAQGQVARGGIDAISQVRNSPVITALRNQRADILRSMGEVQARYGDKHPESIRVRDQLTSIDQQIKDEADRTVQSLRADAAAADARADSLRGSLGRVESQRADNTRNQAVAEGLERDAAAKREAYDKMSELALNSQQVAQSSMAQAVIVDRGQPPRDPASPNKPLFFAMGLIAGLIAGGGVVAVQEMLVSGLQTVEEVENLLGVPVLAAVPKVAKASNPADIVIEKPTSLFSESLRIARTSIFGSRSVQAPHVLALTSALPSEGKTTTSLAFARMLALNGAHTLIIDCDVRRAALRQLLPDVEVKTGLVEILHGNGTVAEAIQPSGVEGLDHLLVRQPYFSSENLFGDGKMQEILNEVRGKYDTIVLDLPPLIGLADGRLLAAMADATALIIRWSATPANAASSALGWLKTDGANPIGAIFTMVDSSAEAIGGLYYSKKYSSYYQSA